MNTFAQNIIHIYGDKGSHWLSELPILTKELEVLWNLCDLKPVSNLSYNYVLKGTQNNKPIILKLSLDIEGLKKESKALSAFSDFGSVKVLEQRDGALLLERAVSGISLKSYFPEKDVQATEIVCNLMKTLHQSKIPKDYFPHMSDWLKVLDKKQKINDGILQKARTLRDQLLATAEGVVLLHGDFHHDNILQNENNWVVIDPKGIIGEVAFEIPAFIFNPIPELLDLNNAHKIIENRVNQFSASLNIKKERILHWCFVRAVLSLVWNLEDGIDTQYFEKLIKIFVP